MMNALVLFGLLAASVVAGEDTVAQMNSETFELLTEKTKLALQWAKQMLERAEQNTIPSLSLTNFTASNTKWGMIITDLKATGLSNLVVDSFVDDFDSQSISIQARFPQITLTGQHDCRGQELHGKGDFQIVISEYKADMKVKFGYTIFKKFKVSDVSIKSTVGDIQVNAPNLLIDGVDPSLVNETLSALLLEKVRNAMPRIPQVIAGSLRIISNHAIGALKFNTALFRTKKFIKNNSLIQ